MKTDRQVKRQRGLKQKLIIISSFSILFIFVLSCSLLPQCSSEDKKITGEQLSKIIKKIDDDVKVSREKIDEFEKLEKEDFDIITPYEILELISFDNQYNTQEEASDDSDLVIADFIDGRKIMIVRFKRPGKIESFYLQFQSNLYNQGYNFEDRLKYTDLCNSYINEEQAIKAYLLKRQNYFIVLIK